MGHKQKSVGFPDAFLDRVDSRALSLGVSRSALIRMGVSLLLGDIRPEDMAGLRAAAAPGAEAMKAFQDADEAFTAAEQETPESAMARMGFTRHSGLPEIYYREADWPLLEKMLAPQRATRGDREAPPMGYMLITVEERDVGKDAWMTPADAGIS